MRILIAPDKFKDALTAEEVATAIQEGIKSVFPKADITLLPLADGGDGTADLLIRIRKAERCRSRVKGPLFGEVEACWGFLPSGETAFTELAEASGLRLLSRKKRNPLHTSTFGTGEVIALALQKGAKQLILGLGGSATNEGGTGMAAALGFRFLDKMGKLIEYPCGKDLIRIRRIDSSRINPRIKDCRIIAACDVNNPLLGAKGATYTFGPQKGAGANALLQLEEGMENLSEVIKKDLGRDVSAEAGSGAAGGAGAGVTAFLNGELRSGAELLFKHSRLNEHLQQADLLITGEGKVDHSSFHGKLLEKLCERAGKASVPLVVFCGSTDLSSADIERTGIQEVIPVSAGEKNLQEALKNCRENLQNASRKYFLKAQAAKK